MLQELVRANDLVEGCVVVLAFWMSRTEGRVWGLVGVEGALPGGESAIKTEGGNLVGRMDGWV